jgi:dTDP-4-amino-4,6-dideoxygalactose transaminase
MAAFSFYPTKNLGALGDSGSVTTNSKELADKVISRRSYGQGNSKYDHVSLGWNSRLDPLQAVILSYHLTRLEEFTETRRGIAREYKEAVNSSGVLNVGPIDVSESVWHHFVIRVNERAEVLDVSETPIKGLYAAGEMVGGIFYYTSPSGGGLMAGSVFGKIAGENAVTSRFLVIEKMILEPLVVAILHSKWNYSTLDVLKLHLKLTCV